MKDLAFRKSFLTDIFFTARGFRNNSSSISRVWWYAMVSRVRYPMKNTTIVKNIQSVISRVIAYICVSFIRNSRIQSSFDKSGGFISVTSTRSKMVVSCALVVSQFSSFAKCRAAFLTSDFSSSSSFFTMSPMNK